MTAKVLGVHRPRKEKKYFTKKCTAGGGVESLEA